MPYSKTYQENNDVSTLIGEKHDNLSEKLHQAWIKPARQPAVIVKRQAINPLTTGARLPHIFGFSLFINTLSTTF